MILEQQIKIATRLFYEIETFNRLQSDMSREYEFDTNKELQDFSVFDINSTTFTTHDISIANNRINNKLPVEIFEKPELWLDWITTRIAQFEIDEHFESNGEEFYQ